MSVEYNVDHNDGGDAANVDEDTAPSGGSYIFLGAADDVAAVLRLFGSTTRCPILARRRQLPQLLGGPPNESAVQLPAVMPATTLFEATTLQRSESRDRSAASAC